MLNRTLIEPLRDILMKDKKMAFVSGPRQVGKTTLAEKFQTEFKQSLYFNWDNQLDRKKLIGHPYFFEEKRSLLNEPFLVVFDEIHKYARWKNYLKGVYDTYHKDFRFLITGSGRLDIFKKGGDSLLGRYYGLPLYPLTMGELCGRTGHFLDFKSHLKEFSMDHPPHPDNYDRLYRFSGFPEPYLKSTERSYLMWSDERNRLLIREDIRDASRVREISLLETLAHLIPGRIGSPLSINSLKEDVGVAFETVRDWLHLFENFYYLFRVPPYSKRIARALRKESKVYLYDWGEVSPEGYRFENLVGLHLHKAVRLWQAKGEGRVDLYYLRDKEKREVDFLIAENNEPLCLIECKTDQEEISPSLLYYQQKFNGPVAVQLLHKKGISKKTRINGHLQWTVSADRWLETLP